MCHLMYIETTIFTKKSNYTTAVFSVHSMMRPLKCRHSNMEVVFGSPNLCLLLVITLVGTFTNYTGLWSSNRDVIWLPPLPGSIYGFID